MRQPTWATLAALALVWGAAVRAASLQGFDARWRQLRSELKSDDLYRVLWDLPKGGDLHNHHEYSIPMTFWIERALQRPYWIRFRLSPCGEAESFQWQTLRRESLDKLPACAQGDFKPVASLSEAERREWLAAITLDPSEGKDEFFDRAVRRLADLEREPELIADALVVAQQQMQAENAVYLETQADPRSFIGMSEDEGAAVLRRRLAQPDSLKTGVAVRMQVSTVRFLPGAEDDLADGFAFVHRNRDLWVGTNLVGREDDERGRPARFVKRMADLRRKYPDVLLSLHAGESSTRDTNIRESIALGATRIGHGTNAYLDPETMALLRRGPYLVEVSLLSNQSLGYVPDLRTHPFPKYLRQGIPVCLNTDDRGIMDSNLTDEYFAAVALFDLSWAELKQIGRWSLEFSFAEPALKKELLARFEKNVAAFERKYSAADWQQRLAQVEPHRSGSTARILKLRGK